jgi:hypothetical protein
MSTPYLLLFPWTLVLGWMATRSARHVHRTKGSPGDRLTLLIVGWSPLGFWLIALLTSFIERHP